MMGYKTIDLGKNLSSFLALFLPAVIISVLILPFSNIRFAKKIYDFLSSKLYFGFFIGLLSKSFMNIGICCILAIRKGY
jgi:hypothetical protein